MKDFVLILSFEKGMMVEGVEGLGDIFLDIFINIFSNSI